MAIKSTADMNLRSRNHRYGVTYTVESHPDGILGNEVPDGHGAADALIVISMVRQKYGVSAGCTDVAACSVDRTDGSSITGSELMDVAIGLIRAIKVSDRAHNWEKEAAADLIDLAQAHREKASFIGG